MWVVDDPYPLFLFENVELKELLQFVSKIGNLNLIYNESEVAFNISFVSEEVDNFEITIIDAFGKMISHEDKQGFIGEYTKQIDLIDNAKGIYFLEIETNNGIINKKLILQ